MLQLPARFPEDPVADRQDEIAVLDDVDEGARLEQAALGMLDTQQRFRSAEPTGRQVDDGLVVQPQPAVGNGVADLLSTFRRSGAALDSPCRKSS